MENLLLKDLCMRLPYGVLVRTPKGIGHLNSINQSAVSIECGVNIDPLKRDTFDIKDVVPLLRPMSNLTLEEYESIPKKLRGLCECRYHLVNKSINESGFEFEQFKTYTPELIDWMLERHYDINNLIKLGAAENLEAINNLQKQLDTLGLWFEEGNTKYSGVIDKNMSFQEHCSKCDYAERCPYLYSSNDTPGPCYYTPYLYDMHYVKVKK